MDRKGLLNPNSQKNHRNWEKPKIQKSQMNGQTEISLHNQILRSEAKARQF
ncbi:YpzG family protein [Ureibacillus sp. 179-F W5.1 NHS]|uniref:YpzG family protein n=1 Tax=unclassified Ureibacillus TaxID=2638520 RepID=UPI0031192ACA